MKKTKRGGKRNGAGRKPAPYKTITLSFRVRVEWAEDIRRVVKEKLKAKASELSLNNQH